MDVRFKTRLVAVSFAVILLAGCGKPDVYAMSRDQAYKRLNAAHIEPSGDGPFFRLATTVSGNGVNEVTWDASGSMAHHKCTMTLAKEDADKTKVAVDCDGGSAGSGAAAGMEHAMIRNRVIEMVDATLKGRPFNPALASGATAARWPGDGVDGSMIGAMAGAIKMEGDIKRDIREMERKDKEYRAEVAAETPDDAQGMSTEPQ